MASRINGSGLPSMQIVTLILHGLACVANASSGAGGGTGKGQASTLSTLSGRKTMSQTLNQPIPDYSMASWMTYMRMLPTSNGFTDQWLRPTIHANSHTNLTLKFCTSIPQAASVKDSNI